MERDRGFLPQYILRLLPLPGSSFQVYIPVGCHAVSVHNDTYTSLVSFGIDVIESHHIYSVVLEVARGVSLNSWATDEAQDSSKPTADASTKCFFLITIYNLVFLSVASETPKDSCRTPP